MCKTRAFQTGVLPKDHCHLFPIFPFSRRHYVFVRTILHGGNYNPRTKKRSLTAIGNHGGGIYWPLVEDAVIPPLSPFLAPTPLSPVGLETLYIPGFHHREAKSAPWVSKRGFVRDDFSQMASRGSVDIAEGSEARDKARVMCVGEESKEDSLWDFATRKFPRNAREVSKGYKVSMKAFGSLRSAGVGKSDFRGAVCFSATVQTLLLMTREHELRPGTVIYERTPLATEREENEVFLNVLVNPHFLLQRGYRR